MNDSLISCGPWLTNPDTGRITVGFTTARLCAAYLAFRRTSDELGFAHNFVVPQGHEHAAQQRIILPTGDDQQCGTDQRHRNPAGIDRFRTALFDPVGEEDFVEKKSHYEYQDSRNDPCRGTISGQHRFRHVEHHSGIRLNLGTRIFQKTRKKFYFSKQKLDTCKI